MNHQKQPKIPTVKGLPLLGIIPKMLGKNPIDYLKTLMLEHGEVFKVNFGPKPAYFVSSPELLQYVLRDNYLNFGKPAFFFDTLKEIVGNGLVVSEGDFWLRQRRMIQPHLHRKQLGQLFTDMVDAISNTLSTLITNGKQQKEVNLNQLFADVTINVIMRTMFGSNILSQAEIRSVGECFMRMTVYVGRAMFLNVVPKWVPLPERRQFKKDLEKVKQTIRYVVSICRQNTQASAGLMQMLLDAVDEEANERMTEQQLFDEVITIFVAGYETTATALTWLGVVIAEQPEIQTRLQQEVAVVLGSAKPTLESATKLSTTRNTFKELLRKYTVLPFMMRSTNKSDMLGQYVVPENTLVCAFLHGVHHTPSIWDNPDKFSPDRFNTEEGKKHHAFAFLPFSGGPRKCVGDEFALLEGQLIIAMLIQQFEIIVPPNQDFSTRFGGTNRPKNGVKVVLKRR